MNSKRNIIYLAYFFFLVCFSISSINSKAAGLAWFILLIFGIAVWIIQGFRVTGFEIRSAADAKIWLFVTGIAFLLKILPAIYWQDSWSERHAEIRLFLGAMGTYALCRWGTKKFMQPLAVYVAASVCCGLALHLMLFDVREAAPTNPIPWAVSIALVSAMLAPMAFSIDELRLVRWICGIGSLMGLLAVLISESRGAYGLIIYLLILAIYNFKNVFWAHQTSAKSMVIRLGSIVLAIAIGGGLLAQTTFVQRPVQRIQVALDEINLSQKSLESNINGSIGARFYMWARSVSFVEQSPWIGHGKMARKDAIVQWGKDQKSEHVQSLGHVHNEYLHSMMDYGAFGLASLLFYAMGMVFLVFRTRARGANTQSWAISGVLFIHITSGLTNVNFAHNYYPTMLSIVMSLILLSCSMQSGDLKKDQ